MKPFQSSLLIASILYAMLAAVIPARAEQPVHTAAAAPTAPAKVAETDAALRDLWVGHVFWVRNVVVDTLAGNKKAAAAAEKEVVANAKAIAGAI